VLASYCDALGLRSFATQDLAADISEQKFTAMTSLIDIPLINLNPPSIIRASRWRTGRRWMNWVYAQRQTGTELGYHPRALPLAVPAATAQMAAMRGMELVVLRPEGSRCPKP